MIQETKKGVTYYCVRCEAEGRATPEAKELLKDLKHTCKPERDLVTKEKEMETNVFFWGRGNII